MGTVWLERSIVCLMSHSWLMVMAGLEPRQAWSCSHPLDLQAMPLTGHRTIFPPQLTGSTN